MSNHEYGKLLKRIWGDTDFRNLNGADQLLYAKLISQSDLSLAGVVTLAIPRWAKQTAGLTEKQVQQSLGRLEDALYIVIDDDTQELLVRTFIRTDRLWLSSKTVKGIINAANRVLSGRLRAEISRELLRIDVSEVSDRVQPSTGLTGRQIVGAAFAEFIEQNKPRQSSSADTLSDTLCDTPSDRVSGVELSSDRTGTGTSTGTSTRAEGAANNAAHATTNGTRVKPGWMPTQDTINTIKAEYPQLDLNYEHSQFIDYWQAAPGQRGVKLDWDATWRRWMRKQGRDQDTKTGYRNQSQIVADNLAKAQARDAQNELGSAKALIEGAA